jgi:hypothetical protein
MSCLNRVLKVLQAAHAHKLAAIFLLGFMCITQGQNAHASGTLIPAPNRKDMVYDSSRDIVYITERGAVLQYKISSNTFLPPFVLSDYLITPYTAGASLNGIDLSPDGNTLAVAESLHSETEVWIHLVDLQTGTSKRAIFPRTAYEDGTFSVAYSNDGTILITSRFEGSGWVPMRRYDPATGTTTLIAPSVRQDTMLTSSSDGGIIGFAESNSSDGPLGRYRGIDGDLLRKSGYTDGTSWFNYEIGVNHNGSQFAVPTYGGTFIYDAALRKIATIGQYAGPQPIGVVYHPAENIVYFAWSGSPEVRAFDTVSFAPLAPYNFEDNFTPPGNRAFIQGRLKTSRDGSFLFATVSGGVRYLRLYDPLSAIPQNIITDEGRTVAIKLAGSVGNSGKVSYAIKTGPSHGTLSGTAPNLTYTPGSEFFSQDTIEFNALYGAASATAKVTITVNHQPVADNLSITTNEDSHIKFSLSGSDSDGDKLTYTITSAPAHGGVTGVYPDLTYSPYPDYNGTDSFTYEVSDGKMFSEIATVNIRVSPVNDPPVANYQTFVLLEDTPQSITLTASDIDGDALTYSVVTPPLHGTLSGAAPNLFYTPTANYNGPDSFTFKANDGFADSIPMVVTLSVSPVNDGPVARPDSVKTVKNTAINIPVLANDIDGDGDKLFVTAVSKSKQGGLTSINADGSGVKFTPRRNYTGMDSFTYTISDGNGGAATATVNISVLRK